MYQICFAGVVYVPGDEPTIQAGIDVAKCLTEATVPAISMEMEIRIAK